MLSEERWRWIGHTLCGSNDIAIELEWNLNDTWKRSLDRELAVADTTWLQIKTLSPNRIRWRDLAVVIV